MLLTGVQLTTREHDRVALEAHIDAATGDGQKLQLTRITVATPEGATLTTEAAIYDGTSQCLRSSKEVLVQRQGGSLLAPGATLWARTGEIILDGPVRGLSSPQVQKSAADSHLSDPAPKAVSPGRP